MRGEGLAHSRHGHDGARTRCMGGAIEPRAVRSVTVHGRPIHARCTPEQSASRAPCPRMFSSGSIDLAVRCAQRGTGRGHSGLGTHLTRGEQRRNLQAAPYRALIRQRLHPSRKDRIHAPSRGDDMAAWIAVGGPRRAGTVGAPRAGPRRDTVTRAAKRGVDRWNAGQGDADRTSRGGVRLWGPQERVAINGAEEREGTARGASPEENGELSTRSSECRCPSWLAEVGGPRRKSVEQSLAGLFRPWLRFVMGRTVPRKRAIRGSSAAVRARRKSERPPSSSQVGRLAC